MSLCARLCALCAMSALIQMAVPQEWESDGLRMIGGMLMLHLVLSGAETLGRQILGAKSLHQIFEVLIR